MWIGVTITHQLDQSSVYINTGNDAVRYNNNMWYNTESQIFSTSTVKLCLMVKIFYTVSVFNLKLKLITLQ